MFACNRTCVPIFILLAWASSPLDIGGFFAPLSSYKGVG
jgi:hypothetical protein